MAASVFALLIAQPPREERDPGTAVRAGRGGPEPLSDEGVISRGVLTLLHELTGRGATRATTTIGRDHVVVFLYEALTKAEKLLATEGHRDHVIASRLAIQDVMRARAIRLVEETLRREVVGFLCANQIDPDISAAIFMLGPAQGGQADGAVPD